jgi:hypothetical protein
MISTFVPRTPIVRSDVGGSGKPQKQVTTRIELTTVSGVWVSSGGPAASPPHAPEAIHRNALPIDRSLAVRLISRPPDVGAIVRAGLSRLNGTERT